MKLKSFKFNHADILDLHLSSSCVIGKSACFQNLLSTFSLVSGGGGCVWNPSVTLLNSCRLNAQMHLQNVQFSQSSQLVQIWTKAVIWNITGPKYPTPPCFSVFYFFTRRQKNSWGPVTILFFLFKRSPLKNRSTRSQDTEYVKLREAIN